MTYYEARCVTPDKKKYTIGPFKHKKTSRGAMTLLEQYEKVMTEKFDELSDRIANDMNGIIEKAKEVEDGE